MADPTASFDAAQNRGISRRTLMKGTAWAAPAILVAVSAPLAAASGVTPPPPTFEWADGCGTTGSGGGCANQSKAFQVPFSLSNPTNDDLVFVVTDARAANGGSIPTTANSPGAYGIYHDNGTQDNCTPELGRCATCASVNTANPHAHMCIAAHTTTGIPLWLVFNSLGAASSFVGQITFQWYKQSDCTPVGGPVTRSQVTAIPSGNCA